MHAIVCCRWRRLRLLSSSKHSSAHSRPRRGARGTGGPRTAGAADTSAGVVGDGRPVDAPRARAPPSAAVLPSRLVAARRDAASCCVDGSVDRVADAASRERAMHIGPRASSVDSQAPRPVRRTCGPGVARPACWLPAGGRRLSKPRPAGRADPYLTRSVPPKAMPSKRLANATPSLRAAWLTTGDRRSSSTHRAAPPQGSGHTGRGGGGAPWARTSGAPLCCCR